MSFCAEFGATLLTELDTVGIEVAACRAGAVFIFHSPFFFLSLLLLLRLL
jgi:hypothetical protein